MRLVQDPDGFHLVEPHAFHELSIEATTPEALDRLGDWGHPDGGHAWLAATRLCTAGLQATDDAVAWLQGFAGMLQYAREHGWTDRTGRSIRAHVQYPSPLQGGRNGA